MNLTKNGPDQLIDVPDGLRGVAVTDTVLGDVRGQQGFYHYRQYSATDLARVRSLEDVWCLMLDGRLPASTEERDRFAAQVGPLRRLPEDVLAVLPGIARHGGIGLAALRTALSLLAQADGMPPLWDAPPERRRRDLLRLAAATPTLVAALWRLSRGLQPIPPDPALPHAADYLRMVRGDLPAEREARAVEQYLMLTVDHGFNASTFTARVVTSTGADAGAAVVAALGALSGPLHGGAPSRALELLEAIGEPSRAAAWVRDAVEGGQRIMGFGHAVYRTEDPRSVLLREVAQGLGGHLVDFAVTVERIITDTLAELRPDRHLYANVEFYAGVVMSTCGLPRELFTPTFAVSRTIGWTANIAEQADSRRIIRPAARYVGPPPPEPVPDLEATDH
ncbi:MAG TPA: citrate/2-methylcitrate synthase [Acidimicrobiales bacterium]|nr:citrate/2-methylcitrate synthase [Acidimicrobiales bacterium]